MTSLAVSHQLKHVRRIAKAKAIVHRRKRIPRQQYPHLLEQEYASRIIGDAVGGVRRSLEPLLRELPHVLAGAARARMDAGETGRARQLIDQSRRHVTSNVGDIERIAKVFAERTESSQRRQMSRQVKAALGVDLITKDKGLKAKMDHFANENVALIQSVQRDLHDRVEKIVARAVTEGRPHNEVAKEIEERFGVSESHSRLIARDQIGKLYGQINASRQKDLGIKRFIWRTVGDPRVRDEHDDRESTSDPERGGTPYDYDDPPDGELPGEPVQCRCMAEPVMDDLFEEPSDDEDANPGDDDADEPAKRSFWDETPGADDDAEE